MEETIANKIALLKAVGNAASKPCNKKLHVDQGLFDWIDLQDYLSQNDKVALKEVLDKFVKKDDQTIPFHENKDQRQAEKGIGEGKYIIGVAIFLILLKVGGFCYIVVKQLDLFKRKRTTYNE